MASSLEDEDLQEHIKRYLHQTFGGQLSIQVVIDGKTLRGTIPKGKTQGVHLLAACLPEEVVRFFEPLPPVPGWNRPTMPQETAHQTSKTQGRVETSRLTVIPDEENYLHWPGLSQVFQLERQVIHPRRGTKTMELFYRITSLAAKLDCAAQILEWTRQHWGIVGYIIDEMSL